MGVRVDEVVYSQYVVDMETLKIIEIDEQFTEFLGYTKEDVKAQNLRLTDLIFEEDQERYFSLVQQKNEEAGEAYIAHYLRAKDGSAIFVFCYGRTETNPDTGGPEGHIIFGDLTRLWKQSKELEDNRVMLRDVMDSLVGGVGVFSVDGLNFSANYLSDGFYDVLGIPKERMKKGSDDFSRLLYGEDILKLYDDVSRCVRSGKSTIGEYRFIKIDGGFRWMQVRFSLLDRENGLPRVSAFFLDITDSKQEQLRLRAKNEELHFKSEVDSLTGVYNHSAFIQHVEQDIQKAGEEQYGALLMIDVDDFKMVNDVLGHYEGDRVLVETAKKLNDISVDKGFVGRLGGDEFAVFLNAFTETAEVVRFAGKVCRRLAEIQVQTGYSVSVGISIRKMQNGQFHDFYTEADQALYVAKRGGKNQYILYEPDQISRVSSDQGQTDTYFAESGWVLDDMNDSVYISDMESYELLFVNKILKENLGLEPEDDSWQGQKCYKLLRGKDSPCEFCTNHCLSGMNYYIWQWFSPQTNRSYICKDQVVRWKNQKARMEVAIDITDSDDVKQALESRLEMEYTLRKCILELVSSPNFQQSHRNALTILGDYYGAERTCLCVFREEENLELYEWYADRKESLLDEEGTLKEKYKNGVWSSEELTTRPLILDNIEKLHQSYPEYYQSLMEQQIWSMYSLPLQHNEVRGTIYVINPKRHLGDLTVLNLLSVFLAAEVSKRVLWEKQEYELNYDKLTDTLNRTRYLHDISHISDAHSIGYLVADVDNLKQVNEQFGFDYGNKMVRQVADSIKEAFRGYPVYRFDGDDFAVCCKDIACDDFISRVERLKATLAQNPIGASVGYIWDDYEMDIRKMNLHAEELMKLEKSRRDSQNSVLNEHTRAYSVTNIQQMLENGNFLVYLQPKIDLNTNEICGAEALVRLNYPNKGMISPGQFIPQLERAGLISMIDLWVFEQVCQTLERWKKEGRKRYPISFNFSRITLLEEDLVKRVEAIVERYDIEKEYLAIEITETIGDMENDMISRIAQRLHEQDFQLSMDDFGTKYSSISVLSLMRFDELKLDRSMVHNLVENEISQKVVKHVIAMCQDIGVKCIAEGVESEAQRDLLIEMNCGRAQGYLYSKPIPIEEFEKHYNNLEE